MQQCLRWNNCGFNYGIVMQTLKWFILVTQPSENNCVAENCSSNYTFKVSTSEYMYCTFHLTVCFLKFQYIVHILQGLKITKQHKTHLDVTRTIRLTFL